MVFIKKQSSRSKKDKLFIIQWSFTILGLLMALHMFASGGLAIIGGILLLISAFIISPISYVIPILNNNFISKTVLKFIVSFILCVIGCYFAPETNKNESLENDIQEVLETATTSQTSITTTVTTSITTSTTSSSTSTTTSTITVTTTITTTQPITTTIVYTQPHTEPPITIQENSRTVYYTETGSKYHYDSKCGRGTYYPCTLDEAIRKGLQCH